MNMHIKPMTTLVITLVNVYMKLNCPLNKSTHSINQSMQLNDNKKVAYFFIQ